MNEDQVTSNTSRADDNNPWAAWMDASAAMPFPGAPAQDAWSYWRDACQRAVLFWDVMRQRGDNHLANTAKTTPHVLKFDCTLIADGRKLPRPVNYALVRITPPADAEIDPQEAAVRRRRPARRPRARHRRLQGRQRDRRRAQGRPSLLLHRLPARARARPDDRGHRARRGRIPRARDRTASGRRGQAGRDRQLPGGLGRS